MGGAVTDGVSVDTDDLEYFVDRGRGYASSLDGLLDELRQLRWQVIAEVGPVSPLPADAEHGGGVPALVHLVGEVRANNAFITRLGVSMGAGGATGVVPCQPGSRELCPPTDADRDKALAAMMAGVAPEDAGVHWTNFPPEYRRLHALAGHIEEAERQREAADGSSWFWWDNDDEALAAVDRQLETLRSERAELAGRLGGVDSGGATNRFSAIAAIADETAGFRWEGQHYGDYLIGAHESAISDGGFLFNAGDGDLRDPSGHEVELRHIGGRVAEQPEAAVTFFNSIGVGVTADLPTLLVGNDLSVAEFANYGLALAAASRSVDTGGGPILGFSGEELIRQPRRGTQNAVVWYNPALLFTDGEFEPGFVAGAAVAVLELSDADDVRGVLSHRGHQRAGSISMTLNGGEDPRNILLNRAASDPEATRQIVTTLAEAQGQEWQAGPKSNSLDPILKPRHPFDVAIGPDRDQYWLDEVKDLGNISSPDTGAVSKVAYPRLDNSAYPITTFLMSVAEQDDLSRWVLRYTADSVEANGPMVRDPGTAGGLDAIMATHASVMFEPSDLETLRIEPASLNTGASVPVEAKHWKAVHSEVLRFGRGQALAMATDRLLNQAIVGSIDDRGEINAGPVRPIAQMAARTEAEAYEALFLYSAQLDDHARARNRRVNVAMSGALGLVGGATGPAGGALASATDTAWTAFFSGYPTNNELQARIGAWENERTESPRWQNLAAGRWLEVHIDSTENPTLNILVPDHGWEEVRIRRSDPIGYAQASHVWQHPDTEHWHPIPLPTNEAFEKLFPLQPDGTLGLYPSAVGAVAPSVSNSYREGAVFSFAKDSGSLPLGMNPSVIWSAEWISRP